ncbi:MAG: class I SAM-dependent RNA methyltransferase [Bacilli bacterium]|nr:class I SAM-dependent RNA methyltransferase [Bacilli bacterium]
MHINLKINKLDNQGRGISYYNNKIIFIYNALSDEEVEVEITKETSKYYLGKVINIIKPSDKRVKPKCMYVDSCGGCQLMHLSSEEQHIYKKNKLKDILYKYAGIDKNITFIESDKEYNYRNKVELKVHNNTYAYYNHDSHIEVDIASCLLASDTINEIIDYHSFMNIKNGDITIRSNYQNELLIVINCDKFEFFNEPPANVVGIVVNDKTVYGNNYFFDIIGKYKFKVSYNAFFQINNYVASEIFSILNEHIKGDTLLDLYCGSGVMGISLKDKVNKIIGIEINKNSILDANDNALLNKVSNYKYYVGDTSDVLPTIEDKIDVVVVDPPRSGLNAKTLNDILYIMPKQIAYVSCDPITLARDLNILKEHYNITNIYGLDMFPNTYHCESITVLERR